MDTDDKNFVKLALDFIVPYHVKYGSILLFHSYSLVNENVKACKEIGKAEGLHKSELLPGLLAVIFADTGYEGGTDPVAGALTQLDKFAQQAELPSEIQIQVQEYLRFLRTSTIPKSQLEKVLLDGVSHFLGMADALERTDLWRMELQQAEHKVFDDPEWLETVRQRFAAYPFYTDYARETYGAQRQKNFYDLEKKIVKNKQSQAKKLTSPDDEPELLSNKETEDLFKIAFRNYVDLISVADRKAGLLIQASSILVSIIIAYTIRHAESSLLFMIPAGIILIFSVATAYYAVSASRPQEHANDPKISGDENTFFFGSFDRVDRDFNRISLETYTSGVDSVFSGNKKEVYRLITEETYQVRRVLSRKFSYLARAYKLFIIGLILTLLVFVIVSMIVSLKHLK